MPTSRIGVPVGRELRASVAPLFKEVVSEWNDHTDLVNIVVQLRVPLNAAGEARINNLTGAFTMIANVIAETYKA